MDVSDWVVVVPIIAPREETAAARRMWDVDAPNLLVVDNTPTGEYVEGPWRYHRDPDGGNLGVAASWNVGLDAGADLTIIMSSYLVLDEGLAKTVERMREAANEYGCLSWAACHLWALTRKTVDACGLFDAYFYPAYFEDVCYIRRLELTGCHTAANPMPKLAIPHTCPQARSLALGLAAPNLDKLRARHLAKWGGPFNDEVFTTPFNDPTLTVKDWGPEHHPDGVSW